MADDVWAQLDRAAADHGLLPSQSRAVADLTAALMAFERSTDPTGTAEEMTLRDTDYGLAVWRYSSPIIESYHEHTLLGVICCPCEDWWQFVPVAALPSAVEEAARATWSAPVPASPPAVKRTEEQEQGNG